MVFHNSVTGTTLSIGDFVCRYDGILIYKGLPCGEASVRSFVLDYEQERHFFDHFLGSFRLLITDSRRAEKIFFGDNSGGMCFYYHETKKVFSDSFLHLCEETRPIVPDYNAIAQFMQFGCIYSNDTMCTGIKRTDTNCYYVFNNNELSVRSKELTSLGNLNTYDSLNSVIKTIIDATADLKVAAVVTGGVDSRMVLSNLISLGCTPELCIAEESEHIDVRIAAQIAERLKLPLNIFNKTDHNHDWLEHAFIASDGMNAVLSRYSLILMREKLRETGCGIIFGGLGGELFKNSFLNQDFPFYGGNNPNIERFYRMKVSASNYPLALCGRELAATVNNIPDAIKNELKSLIRKNKTKAYFDMGNWIMSCRVAAQSNLPNSILPIISPLMVRDSMALVYNSNPYKLELQRFARQEVSAWCPDIADIPTDRGLTCMAASGQIMKETLSNYFFLLKVALPRLLLRNKVPGLLNSTTYLSQARESERFMLAFHKCQGLGIIDDECVAQKLPDSIADRTMTVGTLFSRCG